MRTLLWLIVAGVLLYAVYAGYFYLSQRTILFPRYVIPPVGAPAPVAGLEPHWLTTAAGQVEAWYFPPLGLPPGTAAPLFILAHGNAETIDDWRDPATRLQRLGMGVLLVEYPGYGRSQGSPTQADITAALVAGYDALVDHPQVDPDAVVLFGRSVGGGAIATLAVQRLSAGLVLMSTFTSVRAMARGYGLPGFAVRDPFDTLAVVHKYTRPILVLHGRQDTVIPFAHGAALAAAAPDGTLIPLDCGHNDCVADWDAFWRDLVARLTAAGVLPPRGVE
jgi:hypothetical protein